MIETIISLFLVIMTIQLIVRSCFEKKRRKENPQSILYLADIALYAGAVCAVLTTGVCLYIALAKHDLWLTIGFALFDLLGISLILAWKNCCITFSRENFIRKTFLGFSKKYSYNQITAYKGNPANSDVIIYTDNGKFRIDKLSVNGDVFLKLVKHKYRCANSGRALPCIYHNKNDIFKGNVKNPNEFIVVYSLILLFVLAAIVCVAFSITRPATESNTTHISVAFDSYEKDKDELVLKSDEHEHVFVIHDFEKCTSHKEELLSLCDGKTTFDVWVREIKPDKNTAYYSVYQISEGDNFFLSFETTNENASENALMVILILGISLLLLLMCLIFTILIGRNPHRFKPWFIRLFFKEGYINY